MIVGVRFGDMTLPVRMIAWRVCFSSRVAQEIAELASKQLLMEGRTPQGFMTYRAFYNYISSVTFNSAVRPETENTVYQVSAPALLVTVAEQNTQKTEEECRWSVAALILSLLVFMHDHKR